MDIKTIKKHIEKLENDENRIVSEDKALQYLKHKRNDYYTELSKGVETA